MKYFKKKFWQNLVKNILILSLTSSCAGIPAGKVKLENYKNVDASETSKLDLDFFYFNSNSQVDQYHQFDDIIDNKLNNFTVKKQTNKKNKTNCEVKILSKNETKEDGFCEPYFAITFFTLFAIPFYCINDFKAQAILTSQPKETSLKNKSMNIISQNIDLNQTQVKQQKTKENNQTKITNYLITETGQRINEGDYFFDQNNQLTHLLKTYYLEDKVHEIWSLLFEIGFWLALPTGALKNSKISTPEYAKETVENNISEALTRSILNDAIEFEECLKR